MVSAPTNPAPLPPVAKTVEASELGATAFRAFFDQSPFYAAIVAPDGTLVEASRAALARTGFSAEEVSGKRFWEAGWWRDSRETQARVHAGIEAARAGNLFSAELPLCFADGTERIADVVMNPVRGDRGEVEFVMVTGADVTDRVATSRQLAAARQRLDASMIAGELGTYEWDIGADRLYGDPNFARMFSVTLDATGAAPLKDYLAAIHPDDVPMIMERIGHSINTGSEYEADYRVRRIAGDDYRWVTARGRMTKDAAGTVVRFGGVVLDITARKRAEDERQKAADELQRQFRIYDTILSSMDDFAYIFDRQGRFVYVNSRLLHVWAKTLEQALGKTCYDLGYPTWHADKHMREIEQVIATRQPIRSEVPFTGDSGISGIYDYIFFPIFGADGQVDFVAGTTRDVTERKHRENRDRLLLAIDDATRPLTDAREIIQTCARLLGETLGVNRCAYADVEADEDTFNLIGDYNRDVPSIVGQYRFIQFGAECLRLMREGKPYIVEDAETDPRTAAVRGAYRATRIQSVICVPLRKHNRFVAGMAVHQITARRWLPHEVELLNAVASRCWESIERARVQRVLADSEQRLQLAVAANELGVWDLELKTLKLTSSELAKAHHGRAAGASFSYTELLSAIDAADREGVREDFRRAIVEHVPCKSEYRISGADGSRHWVAVRGETTYAPDGTPIRMVGVSLDITQRKRDEAELEIARRRLEDHARSLEASVAERTAKLQETITELETFSYSISHDLRAPLRAMQSFASILATDCGDQVGEEGREYIRRIVNASDRMDRLIQDVLVYSRISRNEIPVERIDLAPFIAGILESYPQFSSANADFEIVHPLDAVVANAAALTQCLSNLMGNAIKFVAPGVKPAIRLWTERDGQRVRLSVRDNGLGIDESVHDKIFGIFYQVDARRGGTGIGLSVVRKAAERMGGSVGLASKPGQGSTFWLELPAARA